MALHAQAFSEIATKEMLSQMDWLAVEIEPEILPPMSRQLRQNA
jgi:hypothetical protein